MTEYETTKQCNCSDNIDKIRILEDRVLTLEKIKFNLEHELRVRSHTQR